MDFNFELGFFKRSWFKDNNNLTIFEHPFVAEYSSHKYTNPLSYTSSFSSCFYTPHLHFCEGKFMTHLFISAGEKVGALKMATSKWPETGKITAESLPWPATH